MDHLNYLFHLYADYAKANPVVAGVMGLWAAGATSFIFIKMPKKAWSSFDGFISNSIHVSDANGYQHHCVVDRIGEWLEQHRFKALSKSYTLYSGRSGMRVQAGSGIHFFFYDGSLGIANRTEEKSQGGSVYSDRKTIVSYTVKIYGFNGRKVKTLIEMISKPDEASTRNTIDVDVVGSSENVKPGRMLKTDPSRIVMHDKLREDLFGRISHWMASEQWYRDRLIAYKLTIMLYGPPGTGKTSIIRAVATMLGYQVVTINLGGLLTGMLAGKCADYGSRTLFIMEDVDDCRGLTARRGFSYDPNYEGPFAEDVSAAANVIPGVTLSEILNVLDGVSTIDGQVFILSTNHIGMMDKAVLRPGRVDALVEVPYLESKHVSEYLKLMYVDSPNLQSGLDYLEENLGQVSVPGSKLYGTFIEHGEDPLAYAKAITKDLTELKVNNPLAKVA